MINTNALLGHTLRILNERAKRAKSLEVKIRLVLQIYERNRFVLELRSSSTLSNSCNSNSQFFPTSRYTFSATLHFLRTGTFALRIERSFISAKVSRSWQSSLGEMSKIPGGKSFRRRSNSTEKTDNTTLRCFSFSSRLNLDVNLELFCMALAYAISREKTAFLQSLMSTNRRVRPYLDIARLFARKLKPNENRCGSKQHS